MKQTKNVVTLLNFTILKCTAKMLLPQLLALALMEAAIVPTKYIIVKLVNRYCEVSVFIGVQGMNRKNSL